MDNQTEETNQEITYTVEEDRINYLTKNTNLLKFSLIVCCITAIMFILAKAYLSLLFFVPLILIILIIFNSYHEELKFKVNVQTIPILIKNVNLKSELQEGKTMDLIPFKESPFYQPLDYLKNNVYIKSSFKEYVIEMADIETSMVELKPNKDHKINREVNVLFEGIFAFTKLPIKLDVEFAIYTNQILESGDNTFTFKDKNNLELSISSLSNFNEQYTIYTNSTEKASQLFTTRVLERICGEDYELPVNRIIYFYNNTLYFYIKYHNFFNIFDGTKINKLKSTLSSNTLKYINSITSILYTALSDDNT